MAEKSKAMVFLFLCSIGIMVIPFIVSCGKGGTVSAAGSGIQMQVVNLSPDLQPINLFIGYVKQNSNSYSYPNPSGYFSLTNIDTPIQIKSYSAIVSTAVLLKLTDPLKPNYKYTLFVTGLKADTLKSIFTIDTAGVPTVGRGKIRFVNASPGSTGLDITANGSKAFTNQLYTKVSKFIEIPAGIYDFKIMPTLTTTVIGELPNITVMDGKVYTLYCYGISGGADSVAFNSGILSNR